MAAQPAILLGNSDKDLTRYSRSNLLDYEVFFGRFSISQLDFLGEACKRVTVLEPPPLRIVNSYIRLRDQGMLARELGQPLGPHDFRSLASELQLDEFLGSGSGAAQAQIRTVFDNFYTYFFGTRNAYGRQLIKEVNVYHDPGPTDQQVLDNAIRNVEKQIAVYFFLRRCR